MVAVLRRCLPSLGIALLFLAGCITPASPPADPADQAEEQLGAGAAGARVTLAVGGTNFGLAAVGFLADAYEVLHPGVRINIVPGLGSSGGIEALRLDRLDLTIATRRLKADELAAGLEARVVYNDAMVLVAHRHVGVDGVTEAQLAALYAGTIRDWSQLGGDHAQVAVFSRERGDQQLEAFVAAFPLLANATWSAPVNEVETEPELYRSIAETPGGVGATNAVALRLLKSPVRFLDVGEMHFTSAAAQDATWPVPVPVWAVASPHTPAEALDFLDFAASPEGQALLWAAVGG